MMGLTSKSHSASERGSFFSGRSALGFHFRHILCTLAIFLRSGFYHLRPAGMLLLSPLSLVHFSLCTGFRLLLLRFLRNLLRVCSGESLFELLWFSVSECCCLFFVFCGMKEWYILKDVLVLDAELRNVWAWWRLVGCEWCFRRKMRGWGFISSAILEWCPLWFDFP